MIAERLPTPEAKAPDQQRDTQRVPDRTVKTGGSVESGSVKDVGKPGAGKPHARFDEGGLETERPSWDRRACRAPAWTAPDDHRRRASPLLYNASTNEPQMLISLPKHVTINRLEHN